MTRDQIIEAGAKALAIKRGIGWVDLIDCRGIQSPSKPELRDEAAAMLDAITEGMGNKLMGREPTKDARILGGLAYSTIDENVDDEEDAASEVYKKMWDAAPWVPGEEK